jgi:steroid delta-isomerase-like uncharacterized protein
MSAERSEAIARRYYEVAHNTRDLDLVEDLLDELLAPDFVHHDPFPGTTPDREGGSQMFALFRTAFPDAEFEIEEVVAGEDGAAVRWTLRGTHEGDWLGLPPTGRRFEIPGMHMIRIRGGKFVEEWRNADRLGLMQQLGVIPAPQQA